MYRLLSSLPPQLGCYFGGSRGLFTPQRSGFEVGGTPYAIAQFSSDPWEASTVAAPILRPGGASKAVGDDQGSDLFSFHTGRSQCPGATSTTITQKLGCKIRTRIHVSNASCMQYSCLGPSQLALRFQLPPFSPDTLRNSEPSCHREGLRSLFCK